MKVQYRQIRLKQKLFFTEKSTKLEITDNRLHY